MSSLAHRVVRQHGFVHALVTAASVFITLVVLDFLGVLFTTLGNAASNRTVPLSPLNWFVYSPTTVGLQYLPFAVGILFSLWFIAPIAAELRLFHVITRSILACGVGAVLMMIVYIVFTAVTSTHFGGTDPGTVVRFDLSGSEALRTFVWSILTGIHGFLSWLPLVILAGVLLWIWLDRHPAKHEVSGMIDEV